MALMKRTPNLVGERVGKKEGMGRCGYTDQK